MISLNRRGPDDGKRFLYDFFTYTAGVLYVLFVGFMYYAHYFG